MDIDFLTDVEVWNYAREASEELVDTCCLYSHSKEKDIMHDTFATILTKAQVRGRPEIDQVMPDEELDLNKIRADSPTAHNDTLKLALSIAANEGF